MGTTWVPKEACGTAWRSSYINLLPECDWKPYERIRLGRSMSREWTSWAKCYRKSQEWKSPQESYACPQDYFAIIVAATDAFSVRILPEIVRRSLPRDICSSFLSRKCYSTENIPEGTRSEKDARRIRRTKIRGKCQFQDLVELHGNCIYSVHVHSSSEKVDMGPVLAQFHSHVAIFFSDMTTWIMQDGDQCTLQRWSSCQRKS